MTTWYVQQDATGTNSGTLDNPWNAWSSIGWAYLAAGDVLKVIGILTPTDYSGTGTHAGVLGNEVVITGYDDNSTIAPLGAGQLRLNRSHTKLSNIKFIGEIVLSSTDTNVASQGTNIHIDEVDLSLTGIKLEYPSGTGASNINRKYQDIFVTNSHIHDAKRGTFVLAGASGATATMQIDGLTVSNVTAENITDSLYELRMESTLNPASYFNDLSFTDVSGHLIGQGASGGCAFRLQACTSTIPMSDGLVIDNAEFTNIGYAGSAGVGGVYIHGFGKNATDYGQNNITNLSVTNSVGAAGALNILRCNFVYVDGLHGENISTGTIDGNGLLIDLYNTNIRAKNITFKDIIGKNGVNNSGCAIMVLSSSSHIEISDLVAEDCRHGIFYDSGVFRDVLIHDCEFNGCTVDGVYGNLNRPIGNRLWNNVFSGTSGARPVNSTQATTMAHDYNIFNEFGVDSVNFTLSANEKINTEQVNKIAGYI